MNHSSYDQSATTLDDILAELENHFGSTQPTEQHQQQSSSDKKPRTPKLAVAVIALFLSLSGAIGVSYIIDHEPTRVQLAQAPSPTDGSVQGLTTTEPSIGYPEYSRELITSPLILGDALVESALGLTCDDATCILASTNWTWASTDESTVPVTCNLTQDIWKFYCPSGVLGEQCTQNPQRVATAQAGSTIDLTTQMTNGNGVYQFHFNEPQTLPMAAMCGAVQIAR